MNAFPPFGRGNDTDLRVEVFHIILLLNDEMTWTQAPV